MVEKLISNNEIIDILEHTNNKYQHQKKFMRSKIMKKDLYDTAPLDELEEDLLNENIKYITVENLDSEKQRYQAIAKSSTAKRELLNQVMKDSEFELFLKTISDNGLNIQETFHNFFHKVVNGTISTKQLSSS